LIDHSNDQHNNHQPMYVWRCSKCSSANKGIFSNSSNSSNSSSLSSSRSRSAIINCNVNTSKCRQCQTISTGYEQRFLHQTAAQLHDYMIDMENNWNASRKRAAHKEGTQKRTCWCTKCGGRLQQSKKVLDTHYLEWNLLMKKDLNDLLSLEMGAVVHLVSTITL
jgi:hypothetical protein